jgi:hypothetical protein
MAGRSMEYRQTQTSSGQEILQGASLEYNENFPYSRQEFKDKTNYRIYAFLLSLTNSGLR